MAYAAASDVAALAPDLLSGASAFSTSSSPTLAEVEAWLSAGSAWLNAQIMSLGYTAPDPELASDVLRIPNALYATMLAEQSRSMPTTSFGERTRGSIFEKLFADSLKTVLKLDWTLFGSQRSAVIHWTGAASGRIREETLP